MIADRVGGSGALEIPERHEWQGEEALALVRQLNAIAPRALFLCAGVSHRELVERSVRELHIVALENPWIRQRGVRRCRDSASSRSSSTCRLAT